MPQPSAQSSCDTRNSLQSPIPFVDLSMVSAPLAENQIGLFVAFSFKKPDLLVGYQCCFVFRLADEALAK